jgi:bacterioferritin-associated ferredoxin
MDACHTHNGCDACPARFVCHCLQVTEEMLHDALAAFDLRSLNEVRRHTGAGDGCTACHRRIRGILERRAVELPVLQASSSA